MNVFGRIATSVNLGQVGQRYHAMSYTEKTADCLPDPEGCRNEDAKARELDIVNWGRDPDNLIKRKEY